MSLDQKLAKIQQDAFPLIFLSDTDRNLNHEWLLVHPFDSSEVLLCCFRCLDVNRRLGWG
jgi:hypothetical protein